MLALWQADRRGVFPAQEKKFVLTNSAQHECEQKGNEEEETRRERNLISEAGVQADLMQGHGVGDTNTEVDVARFCSFVNNGGLLPSSAGSKCPPHCHGAEETLHYVTLKFSPVFFCFDHFKGWF